MEQFFVILSHTPAYAYVIFFYLLFIGLTSSKERVLSFYKPFIAFSIFLFFSLSSLVKIHWDLWFSILFSIVLGVFFFAGWVQTSNKNISIDREKRLMRVPGSWLTLLLLFVIFSSKYYLGFKSAQDPLYISSLSAKLLTIFSSGFSLGMIAGKLVNYLYRFKNDRHTQLS